jgi:hypothetical protein
MVDCGAERLVRFGAHIAEDYVAYTKTLKS